MKKKKGFTLIELLAVIVILAVIALIAVPQVLKILNKARKSAAEDSVYGIVEVSESYVADFMLKNNGTLPSEDLVFNCSSDGCTLDNSTTLTEYNLEGLNKLDYKGTKAKSGTVKIGFNGNNITVTNLYINGFTCNYTGDIATCEKGESGTTPTPSVTGPTSETPNGNGYTGVKAIVYLDPTDLTKSCDASNINSDNETKTGCMKWYAYADDGTNYTMILDHNTTALVKWNVSGSNSRGPGKVNAQLASDTTGWNSSFLNPRLITANEIATITGNTGWDSTSASGDTWFYFDTLNKTMTNEGKYGWLFDRTSSDCTTYGCLNNEIGPSTYGYWTSSPVADISNRAWRLSYNGNLSGNNVSNAGNGVRPVITVEKSKIS